MSGARRTFAIGPCLGRGGFGEVYRATMRSPGGLERDVAVKVLRPDLDLATDAVRRLRDEGRLLARLDHPAILSVLDLVLLEGRVALITEFVDGADLSDCRIAEPALTVRAELQVAAAVSAALAEAHEARAVDGAPLGLVHRDVKPTNIRIGRHGQVKLLDFGIAWSQATDREARTDSDLVVGSLHYMAPERFLEKRAQPAWDVFGVGVSLYEGLASRRFFGTGAMREVSAMALDEGRYARHLREAVRAVGRDTPREALELLEDLLQYDPDARPSAAEASTRCESLADDMEGASLKRWSREVVWAQTSELTGPLEGRTLTEGSLRLPVDEIATSGVEEGSGSQVVPQPLPIVDPAATTVEGPRSGSEETTFIPNPPTRPSPSEESTVIPSAAPPPASPVPVPLQTATPPPARRPPEGSPPSLPPLDPPPARWPIYGAVALLLAGAAVLAAAGAVGLYVGWMRWAGG